MAYTKTGDNNRAIDDSSMAISINPYYAAAHENRANAYYGTGEDDRAESDLGRV